MDNISSLERARLAFQPHRPAILSSLKGLSAAPGGTLSSSTEALQPLFPITFNQPILQLQSKATTATSRPLHVGVVLSGGQAPGGHNVLVGLCDALQEIHPESKLIGFLGGPTGILKNQTIELTPALLASYRNQGGFHCLGSGRTKIETEEQFLQALETVSSLKLDGCVVVGGDDSNTNAAFLAEYFLRHNCPTKVIGVPKTIDGDLKNNFVETSFGFDTACKIYAELIGNLLKDCLSAKKYYHFIKLMGRTASHITLECALQTHPNLALISEEIKAKKLTLKELVRQIADMICQRAQIGKNYGVVLIPEGLVEFIPEVDGLIKELNALLGQSSKAEEQLDLPRGLEEKVSYLSSSLSEAAMRCFTSLPSDIQHQLLLERDPHGNVQVSYINTEKLLMQMVAKELNKYAGEGIYTGKFNPLAHFFGYEGRCGLPSNFDAQYCYALGLNAVALLQMGCTGYMSCLKQLNKPVEEWTAWGIPLTAMMHLEERHGKLKPVIQKTLVNLHGTPFITFSTKRNSWMLEDHYRAPGPIQFFGPHEITDLANVTLQLENGHP